MTDVARVWVLSQAAQGDIEDIFDYSEIQFGTPQAVRYTEGFNACFQKLIQHPHLGRLRADLHEDLYGFTYQEHLVLYRILPDKIRIVRIISTRQDVDRLADEGAFCDS